MHVKDLVAEHVFVPYEHLSQLDVEFIVFKKYPSKHLDNSPKSHISPLVTHDLQVPFTA